MADVNKKNMTLADFDKLVDGLGKRMHGACDMYMNSHNTAFVVNEDSVSDTKLVKLTTDTSWKSEGDTQWATLNQVVLTYLYNDWDKARVRRLYLSRKDCQMLIDKLQGILDAADALDEHVKAIKATEGKAA